MKVLMVCLGNICRSPLAEGILRHKTQQKNRQVTVDSAGTISMHAGNCPDTRSIAVAKKYGIDISSQVARHFTVSDFDNFDYIFVMDASNYADVMAIARNEKDKAKVEMILNTTHPGHNKPVPDPYYGGADGFEKTYKLLDEACDVILSRLNATK